MKKRNIIGACAVVGLIGLSWASAEIITMESKVTPVQKVVSAQTIVPAKKIVSVKKSVPTKKVTATPKKVVSKAVTPKASNEVQKVNWIDQQTKLIESHSNIDPKVLRVSLLAYENAKSDGITSNPILTVIDYSKPSSQKRLWVFNLKNGTTLFNTYVAHGKNSGDVNAYSFSNSPGSLKSSLGVFETAQTYYGKNGYSLHLRGLENGINNNAYERSIVMHGAWYVNSGQTGRSWGCPAVSKNLSTPIINTIKDGSLVVAYYPDKSWLSHSRFLMS